MRPAHDSSKPFSFTTNSPNRINTLTEIPTRPALHWRRRYIPAGTPFEIPDWLRSATLFGLGLFRHSRSPPAPHHSPSVEPPTNWLRFVISGTRYVPALAPGSRPLAADWLRSTTLLGLASFRHRPPPPPHPSPHRRPFTNWLYSVISRTRCVLALAPGPRPPAPDWPLSGLASFRQPRSPPPPQPSTYRKPPTNWLRFAISRARRCPLRHIALRIIPHPSRSSTVVLILHAFSPWQPDCFPSTVRFTQAPACAILRTPRYVKDVLNDPRRS